MDFPNMESECRGRREAFKRIWSQRSARYSALQGGDKWRFGDIWCDSKLDALVNCPQWSRLFTDSTLYLSMSALFCKASFEYCESQSRSYFLRRPDVFQRPLEAVFGMPIICIRNKSS